MFMRNLDFFACAIFALLAVYVRATGMSFWLAVVFIIAAGSSLVSGFVKRNNRIRLERDPITLTPEQKDTIKNLKDQGKGYAAIKQVRLWYRYCDLKTAVELVEQVN